ncbi:MAG: hypothetical protein LBK99_10870 [Opitutaceae bacterium]|nr:hypothetical protein [Opitutaceae bacterium]
MKPEHPNDIPSPRRRAGHALRSLGEGGFALLITIVLVAFLVLLLVALATFTRVETQVAHNSQILAQARQNALMAMNIALGQAQAMLGPDTRVTAPASQTGDGTPGYAAADFDNNANWVGVYRQDPAVVAPSRAPVLLNWLVSGNEKITVPTSGGNTPDFTPDSVVTGLAPAMSATTAVTVKGKPAMLLVGPGTATTTPSDASAIDRFVVAPLIDIQVDSSLVPGLGSTAAPAVIGHFAWWAGDESTKAKVSLIDPWHNPSSATLDATTPSITTAQADAWRFANAQRAGIEFINAYDSVSGLNSRLDSAWPADSPLLSRVLSLSQLPMLNQSASARLESARRDRFHDLTADSFSVIADAAGGGLKKDLTAWAAQSAPASPALDDLITPGHATGASNYGLPRWGLLHSYLNTRAAAGTAIEARPQTATQAGVYPAITYARLSCNITCPGAVNWADDLAAAAANPTAPTPTYRYRFNIMPMIVLWNPWNVPIAKGSEMEFCFKYTRLNHSSDRVQVALFDARPGLTAILDTFDLSRVGVIHRSTGAFTPYGAGDANQFWRFKVELANDLEPGQSRLFTLKDAHDETEYSPGVSALTDADVAPENAVYLRSATTLTAADIRDRVLHARTVPYVSSTPYPKAQIEFLLSRPPSSTSSASAITTELRDAAYQRLPGNTFGFNNPDSMPVINPDSISTDYLTVAFYHRIELLMSTITSADLTQDEFSGTPRWLTTLNPTASTVLRKPSATLDLTPSYLKQRYWNRYYKPNPAYTFTSLPNEHNGDVAAGTEVSFPTAQRVVLRELQPPGAPVFSLAQLQHANVSALNLNPAYAIGNSAANLYVERTATDSGPLAPSADACVDFPATFDRIYDLSWLLNQALWDGRFFSTIPSTLTAAQLQNPDYRLPNARHRFHLPPEGATAATVTELTAPDTAAAHLLLNGGFNVNSTSVEAWRALLASRNGVATDSSNPASIRHPYSRFASPISGVAANNGSAPWMSWRILSDSQIDALATAIVAEVRTRGPFLSLADFVNRRLAADDTGLKGPLQAAIDTISINDVDPFTKSNHRVTDYPADIPGTDAEQRTVYLGGGDNEHPASSRAASAPGFLTQADLLSAIGPALTARSDTLRIRAYGDVMNPVTGNTDPEARAWCEAIVQRLPGYVDPQANTPDATPGALSSVNAAFGRRFRIVSFRWLSPDEI